MTTITSPRASWKPALTAPLRPSGRAPGGRCTRRTGNPAPASWCTASGVESSESSTNISSQAGSTVTLGGAPTASGGTPSYTYSWNNGAASTSNPGVAPTNTTSYIVTVTDSKGCSATATTTVTVHSLPIVSAGLPNLGGLLAQVHAKGRGSENKERGPRFSTHTSWLPKLR